MKQNRIHLLEAFESRNFEVAKVPQITLELQMIYFYKFMNDVLLVIEMVFLFGLKTISKVLKAHCQIFRLLLKDCFRTRQ